MIDGNSPARGTTTPLLHFVGSQDIGLRDAGSQDDGGASDTPLSWLADVYGDEIEGLARCFYYGLPECVTKGGSREVSFRSLESFEESFKDSTSSVAIYHLDSHTDVAPIESLALRVPGILWVHDAVIGEADRILALLSVSHCVLFSSERISKQWEVLRQNSGLATAMHLLPLPAPGQNTKRIKSNTEMTAKRSVAFCGYPTVESRAHLLLEALSTHKDEFVVHWLLGKSELSLAERLMEEFTEAEVVIETPRNGRRWTELTRFCDGAFHLSFSAVRGHGVYLPISLASGCPVLVSDCADSALLPESCVYKIPIGLDEGQHIKRGLDWLNTGDAQCRAAGAQQYAREVHAPELICSELLRLADHLLLRP